MLSVSPASRPQHTLIAVFTLLSPSQYSNALQGIDVVKSRMQGLESAQYSSSLACARDMLKNEGITSFYRGMAPRLARVTCEVAITMSLYGEVVKFLNSVWVTE